MIKYIIITFLIFSGLATNAQESKKYQKLLSNPNYRAGYITLRNGDKIEGLIHYFKSGYKEVHFVDKSGEKLIYTARALQNYSNSRYTYVSGKVKKKKYLFFREADNSYKEVKIYQTFADTFQSGFQSYSDEQRKVTGAFDDTYTNGNEEFYGENNRVYYLKKADEELFVSIEKLFLNKEKGKEYFDSCPELKQKIEANEFDDVNLKDLKEVLKILDIYQTCIKP